MDGKHVQVYMPTLRPDQCPMSFHKAAPVMAFQGLRTITYLDDLLIMNQSLEVLQSQVHQTVQLLESLGFNINWEKSQLVLS